jgi:pyruvate, water dikinase
MEFIISEPIAAHPLALAHADRVSDPDARARVAGLTRGYPDGESYFVQRLSEGIGTIAAAFWPKPVVVRMSDFKTNEYASLVGRCRIRNPEDNPMLGFRGAARYAHPVYAEGFTLECQAMRRVRDEMALLKTVLGSELSGPVAAQLRGVLDGLAQSGDQQALDVRRELENN